MGHLFSFSSLWPDEACLSWLATICKDPIASTGLLHGAGAVINHCQEMCCTQRGRLSSLLLLQLELQILKRCRTCTSQITIHHLGSASPGRAASPPGADPFLLQPQPQPQLELGPRGLFGRLIPGPANLHPG